MLVSSTRDRIMAWAMIFCLIAAFSLLAFLLSRKKPVRHAALAVFVVSLVIPVFILPSVKQEYIHVSPQQIVIDTGTWYKPSLMTLHFNKLSYITEETSGILPANLIGDPGIIWHINEQDGAKKRLELNDFFSAHRMVISYYYTDRGYVIHQSAGF